MRYQSVRDRILAAQKLLEESSTTIEKFSSIKTLLVGVSPKIDRLLDAVGKEFNKLEKLQKGEVIELTVEVLPTHTEKDKKRKKLLLLFLKFRNQLKSEVDRVRTEIESQQQSADQSLQAKAGIAGRIVSLAKGPLGLVTIGAVGLVVLQSIAVTINIKNNGCDPINPVVNMPVAIPGLSLPRETIPSGGSALATFPPLTITVDGTTKNVVKLGVFGYSMTFTMATSGIDIVFDGTSLVGKRSILNLGEKKVHEVVVSCP